MFGSIRIPHSQYKSSEVTQVIDTSACRAIRHTPEFVPSSSLQSPALLLTFSQTRPVFSVTDALGVGKRKVNTCAIAVMASRFIVTGRTGQPGSLGGFPAAAAFL